MNSIVGFIVGAAIIYGIVSLIWYVIKRMLYTLVYVSKKAVEDAKNRNE